MSKRERTFIEYEPQRHAAKRCKGIVKTEVVNTWVDDIRAVHSGGLLMFQRRIFSDEAALEYLNALKNLDYQTCSVQVKAQKLMRKAVWVNGDQIPYRHEGLVLKAQPWTPELLKIKEIVENILAHKSMAETFNSAMINMYEDSSHYLGIHADDEPMWGHDPTVASVSLGDERDFDLISNPSPTVFQTKLRYLLRNASLLVMRGSIQSNWKHALPKRAKAQLRIDITFRRIMVPPPVVSAPSLLLVADAAREKHTKEHDEAETVDADEQSIDSLVNVSKQLLTTTEQEGTPSQVHDA